METTIVLKREDLDIDFIESIKRLFKRSREIQITISDAEDFGLLQSETNEIYLKRLQTAAYNLENKQNQVVLMETEFDKYSENLLK